ncbi:MAG: tetratricopeptide repeat protein, partial [Gammaproteobacteria bacterium]
YNNLGLALHGQDRYEEAIVQYQRAIALKPDYAQAYYNLGNSCVSQGKPCEALLHFEHATVLKGDFALAHWNLSLALLLSGDLIPGWKKYEWRWDINKQDKRNFPCPLWDGEDISGRTILLHAEQGLGDAFQFIRYAPLVAERGARVVVECQSVLVQLLATVRGITRVVDNAERLSGLDMHAPLLSLPNIFHTTLSSIPAQIPYLTADHELVESWRDKIGTVERKLKVGLVWAGNPSHQNDHNRSCSLQAYAPLARVPGVAFFSLQKGPAAVQLNDAPQGLNLIDYTDELVSYSDTAALLANLDLIISVDTSVVHLAGAMGKVVWALLPFAPDWRWLLDREDSPWYPTMRLFRQPQPGDWVSVMESVRAAMLEFLRN